MRNRVPLVASLVSLVLLAGCSASPTDTATSPSTRTPTASFEPSATPTPRPIDQAFGGDCDAMFTEDEVAELIGQPREVDPVAAARERLGLRASAEWSGGIACEWNSDLLGLRVLVLPRDLASDPAAAARVLETIVAVVSMG